MSKRLAFSDEDLLQRLSAGDPSALEALIKDYYAVLCRFAEKFLPDSALAEDIVQESFIKLWRSGRTFDSLTGLKAYLYVTTRNGCLDLLRNRSRLDDRHKRAAIGEEASIEPVLAEIIRAESVALIYKFVESMPEKMRQVFLLSYREGLSVSEIADQLGWKVKAVKKQKYKALVALRGRFGRHNRILTALLATAILLGAADNFFQKNFVCRGAHPARAAFYINRIIATTLWPKQATRTLRMAGQ